MDSRTAAHTLNSISDLLELSGTDWFRVRAYRSAARVVLELDTDDLAPLYHNGVLAATPGIGPATLSVLAELIEQGESSYLERLRENISEGLIEMARVPGLTPPKVRIIHDELGVSSLDELEVAAQDGRLAGVRGFGPKTVARVLTGIATVRETQGVSLIVHAEAEAERLVAAVRRHPDVVVAEIAGEVRRWTEVVGPIAIATGCDEDPERVLHEIVDMPAVRKTTFPKADCAHVYFIDGTQLELSCSSRLEFPFTLWRATGNARHIEQVIAHASSQGLAIRDNRLVRANGTVIRVESEEALYTAIGLAWIPPELREGTGEVKAACTGTLPALLTNGDITGALHCHSTYSDGTATIAEMAEAARARGWRYIGMTDHSVSAFYAGGLSREDVRRQHDEIDRLNAETPGFTILKGIECDILANGTLDYGDTTLDAFDYVIGSIHSRFSMSEAEMTQRVLTAMDDPRLTILAHPTGRLLLTRPPYAIDLDAVIDKAAECGVVLELNADSQRLDLDWRWCRKAKARGVMIEIGPDAHSTRGLDNVWLGVRMARKAWLTTEDVLNARDIHSLIPRRPSVRL